MSLAAFGEPCREYRDQAAEYRLADLRLSRDQLRGAIAFGDQARGMISPLCPKTFPGQVMWAETVRGLRDRVIGAGHDWRPGSGNNYETVDSDALRVSIAFVGGDRQTGRSGPLYPTTARARGPLTRERVRQNLVLAQPLPGLGLPQDSGEDVLPYTTWFLMAHGRREAIQAELSLPHVIGEDGFVKAWAERILLDDIEATGGLTPVEMEPTPTPPSIHVRRRS